MRLTAAACCELAAAHGASEVTRVDASGRDVEEVDDLSSLTSLVRLDLSDNPRLRSLDGALESTSASLKHLVAARCPGISPPSPSVPPLLPPPSRLRLPQLRVVDLSSCGIASFDASAAPKLSALILTGNAGLRSISGLSSCPELATLVVKGCGLDDATLSRALRGVTTVSKLSAAHNALRGGKRLDLSSLEGSLSELRLGHNDLDAIPSGLGPRLRLLDAGGNERLGPLSLVVEQLSSVCRGSGGDKGSWLRSVTLRGTAASRERGYKRAIASAVPALRVLDDKRLELGGADDETEGEAEAEKRARKKEKEKERRSLSSKGGDDDEDEEERRQSQRRRLSRAGPAPGGEEDEEEPRKKEKKKKMIAVGRLADEVGLGGGGEEKEKLPLSSSSRLPPPPPPATPAPASKQQQERGSAAVAVIEVKRDKKKKKKKGSDGDGGNEGDTSAAPPVATGKDAAALLRASASAISPMGDLDVGGW